jgi:hypothetical protein
MAREKTHLAQAPPKNHLQVSLSHPFLSTVALFLSPFVLLSLPPSLSRFLPFFFGSTKDGTQDFYRLSKCSTSELHPQPFLLFLNCRRNACSYNTLFSRDVEGKGFLTLSDPKL